MAWDDMAPICLEHPPHAARLESACGGNSSRSPLQQPCAAAKQGKAEWENQQLPRASQFCLHSKSHNTQSCILSPGGCPD